MVIFQPKNPNIKTTKYSLTKGDVIKKERVTPNGTPAFKKLKKIGIDEQEQKGVIAPNDEAIKLLNPYFFPLIHFLTLFCERYVLKNPTIDIITIKSKIILIES